MNPFSKEQVLSLAPDVASAKAGQQLATRSQWKSLGRSERAAWGEIQGSGKKPYQVRVDLRDQATKCSCPSRKFPCKHALGLMLLAAEKGELGAASPPAWVTEWIDGRDERAEKRKTAEAQPTEPVRDEAAAAKRAKSREQKVQGGLAELSLWMQDLVRTGLAAARQQPTSFWESVAARMVDAQAPGLARYIRLLYAAIFSGDGWQQRALRTVGRMQLLIEAHSRIERLPAEVQATIRDRLGAGEGRDPSRACRARRLACPRAGDRRGGPAAVSPHVAFRSPKSEAGYASRLRPRAAAEERGAASDGVLGLGRAFGGPSTSCGKRPRKDHREPAGVYGASAGSSEPGAGGGCLESRHFAMRSDRAGGPPSSLLSAPTPSRPAPRMRLSDHEPRR